jgi:tRNA pseudouridine38-40 synthase
VHALHQIIHFDTEAERQPHSWVFGANVNLPGDVSVSWAQPVDAGFHARYSAISRIYRYVIFNRPARTGVLRGMVTWECRRLDPARMARAAEDLVGEHDFTSYRGSNCQARSPVRKVTRLDVRGTDDDFLIIEIEANAFLHHMVRNIAGVLMAIGMGRQPVGWAKEVLEARERAAGGITAPSDGLYLARVVYPDQYAIPGPFLDRWCNA